MISLLSHALTRQALNSQPLTVFHTHLATDGVRRESLA